MWGVKSAVWSVKCEGSSGKWEVWSVECEVWSLSLECEERSVKCEVWSVKEAVRSEKCGVWSVKCGVWSLKFGVRRVQCAVWGVECRGKDDTVGTGCLWTIGHLCLGNFRRRLARVYVKMIGFGAWKLTWGNHFVRRQFLIFWGFTGVCWGITPSLVPSPFCKPLTWMFVRLTPGSLTKWLPWVRGKNVQGDVSGWIMPRTCESIALLKIEHKWHKML